ncbi:LysM peptidoglycan-binding domain-containing protein [Kyrpidia tusciae]|nr:LysM domain-containing protein [Kyrpidia tusciae]
MGTPLRGLAGDERMEGISLRASRGKARRQACLIPGFSPARESLAWSRTVLGIGVLFLMGLGTAGGVLLHHHPHAEAGEDRSITVQEGDTLWNIASRYAGPDVDRREWIYQLRQMNHLSGESVLYPGMILHLPSVQ